MLLRFHLVVQDLNCRCHHHKIQARCGQPDSDTYLPNPICSLSTALHRFFIHFGNSAIYLATRASRASGGFGRLAPGAPRRRQRGRLKVHWIGRGGCGAEGPACPARGAARWCDGASLAHCRTPHRHATPPARHRTDSGIACMSDRIGYTLIVIASHY